MFVDVLDFKLCVRQRRILGRMWNGVPDEQQLCCGSDIPFGFAQDKLVRHRFLGSKQSQGLHIRDGRVFDPEMWSWIAWREQRFEVEAVKAAVRNHDNARRRTAKTQ